MNWVYKYVQSLMIITGIICFSGSLLEAQMVQLELVIGDEIPKELRSVVSGEEEKIDSMMVPLALKKIQSQIHQASYLEASFDTITYVDSTCFAHLHIGPRYNWVKLETTSKDKLILEQAGFRPNQYTSKPFQVQKMNELFEKIVVLLENAGYPFASVHLGDVDLENGSVNGSLKINKNQMIAYDSLNLIGNAKIGSGFLSQYLDIKEGEPYNQKNILQIVNRIKEVPFLTLRENPTVTFRGKKAVINLMVDEKNASRFDFLIGVLPDINNVENRYTITGELTMDMTNKLGKGEHMFLQFKRLKRETQELELVFNYPYILNLPFGLDTRFDLFRNANDNRDLNFDLGFDYFFKANNYLKVFWNNNSSRLLAIDSTAILNTKKLPPRLDVGINNLGLELAYSSLDYRLNPRKGYTFRIRSAAGLKNTIKNNQILSLNNNEIDFETAYDSLQLSTYLISLESMAELYLPIFQTSTILTRLQGAYKYSKDPIYLNEYYRIGGYRRLRGFDEASIFAEYYGIATMEYRLLIGENSFISAFFDYGLVQNDFNETFQFDLPYGFGAGLSFETQVGVFGLSLAVGSEKGNAVDLRNAKTHFGYINLF